MMRNWPLLATTITVLASFAGLAFAAYAGDVTLILAQLVALVASLIALATLSSAKQSTEPANRLLLREVNEDLDAGEDSAQSKDSLDHKQWMELVEEIVSLLEELARHRNNLDPLARELADHVNLRLEEILERSGVEVIANEASFERSKHQAEKRTTHARPGDPILETIRPGLAVGRRVLRRAVVRLGNGEPGAENKTST
jgi:hypothetical protein